MLITGLATRHGQQPRSRRLPRPPRGLHTASVLLLLVSSLL